MIQITETKTLHGSIDLITKVEHSIVKKWFGIKIREQHYVENFHEEESTKNKHIGFKKTNDVNKG